MPKIETKASDSRQSVDLKWKLRKGLEENVAFKEDGTMEVSHGIESDGNIMKGCAGIYRLPVNGTPRDVVVFEGYNDFIGAPLFFTFYWNAGNGLMCAYLTNESGEEIHSADEIPSSEVKPDAVNTIALLGDVPTSQWISETFSNARFQHTITIIGSRPVSGGGACAITLTAYSSKNTPVDSYQDLNSVFGGCALSVSGLYSPASGTNRGAVKLDLHGGTIAKDMLYYSDPSMTTLQSVALSACGDITFTDDVCIPK